MKGSMTIPLVLLTSAALGFGQTPGMQASAPPVPYSQPTYAADYGRSQQRTTSPGTVNFLEGSVSVDNQPVGRSGLIVLRPGQTLSTGDGFAEVLLTPGAFLRLGNNSQLRLTKAGLAAAQVQLDRGSAMLEVDQLIQGTTLTVAMTGGTTQIEKNGLYDFDVNGQAVRVLDGKANVVAPAGDKTIGKDGQLLLASAKPLKKSSVDTKTLKAQPLFIWSQARSEDESQANVSVAQNIAAYGGWYGAGWYWDPYWTTYAFLPGAGFLYSPFGWGFYSPAFVGYYGVGHYGFYGRPGYHGYVGGVSARVNAVHANYMGGFHGGSGGGGARGGGHR